MNKPHAYKVIIRSEEGDSIIKVTCYRGHDWQKVEAQLQQHADEDVRIYQGSRRIRIEFDHV